MRAMPSQIELYEEMQLLSAHMVEAAQAHEWDRLIDLETRVSALRQTLMSNGSSVQLSATEVEAKRLLIQRILDDDAEIRRYTEPWMEHVRQFLGSTNRRKEVERAYGAAG